MNHLIDVLDLNTEEIEQLIVSAKQIIEDPAAVSRCV